MAFLQAPKTWKGWLVLAVALVIALMFSPGPTPDDLIWLGVAWAGTRL